MEDEKGEAGMMHTEESAILCEEDVSVLEIDSASNDIPGRVLVGIWLPTLSAMEDIPIVPVIPPRICLPPRGPGEVGGLRGESDSNGSARCPCVSQAPQLCPRGGDGTKCCRGATYSSCFP